MIRHATDSTLRIGPPQSRRYREGSRLSASLTLAGEQIELYLDIPAREVPPQLEPFLALALFPAMRQGVALQASTGCSPLFLANLERLQDYFTGWDPTLSRIPIRAPIALPEPPAAARRTAAFFSGGVDSFHTLVRHADQIDDLVFVHGFDIPLYDFTFFDDNAKRYQTVATHFRKNLRIVRTNLRVFTDRFADWGHYAHGAALAAVALALSSLYGRVIIPGEFFPEDGVPPPRGSHPATDPLWVTEHLTLDHDGFDRTRMQKLSDLQASGIVREMLRVCWQRNHPHYNCCVCGKCLRNMAILRALGVLDRFPVFHRDIDLERLARQPVTMAHWREMLKEILTHLGSPPRDPLLAQALHTSLHAPPQKHVRGIIAREILTRVPSL